MCLMKNVSVLHMFYSGMDWSGVQSTVCVCVCVCVYLHACVCAKSLQSCLTLCNPVYYSPPGSSVHGILQARILEWVAMPSSRGSSSPRDRSCISCIAGRFYTTEPLAKPTCVCVCVCVCVYFIYIYIYIYIYVYIYTHYIYIYIIRWL